MLSLFSSIMQWADRSCLLQCICWWLFYICCRLEISLPFPWPRGVELEIRWVFFERGRYNVTGYSLTFVHCSSLCWEILKVMCSRFSDADIEICLLTYALIFDAELEVSPLYHYPNPKGIELEWEVEKENGLFFCLCVKGCCNVVWYGVHCSGINEKLDDFVFWFLSVFLIPWFRHYMYLPWLRAGNWKQDRGFLKGSYNMVIMAWCVVVHYQ